MADMLPSLLLDGPKLPARLLPSSARVGSGDGGARRYKGQIRLGTPGGCPDKPMHVHFVPDSSGSITSGTGAADPIGMRWVESMLAIERIGKRCTCEKELVSVHHFDHPTSLDLIGASIAKDRKAIEEALAIPPDAGGRSELGRGLTSAEHVAHGDPDHHHVIVPMTDFALSDWPSLANRLDAFPGDVYAAVLRSPAVQFGAYPNVHAVSIDSSSEPGTMAKFIFNAFNDFRPPTALQTVAAHAKQSRRAGKKAKG